MRLIAAALLAFAATATAQPSATADQDIARRVRADVEFLASDNLDGRDTGSKGYAIAAISSRPAQPPRASRQRLTRP